MLKYCPECGSKISSKAQFCPECGEKLPSPPVLHCDKCGEPNNPKSRFCEKCGERIAHPDTMVICPKCGEVGYSDDSFCMHCGADWYGDEDPDDEEDDVEEDSEDDSSSVVPLNSSYAVRVGNKTCITRCRDKWIAFLLCLFLGGFGFHKFYEGRIIWGIIYLFTGGLFGVGWIIDCIILLFKPNPYYI